jgi:hypothetical protein
MSYFQCESVESIFDCSKCVICCGDDTDDLTLVKNGLKSLKNASAERSCNNLSNYLSYAPDCSVRVHEKCRKRFTDLRSVAAKRPGEFLFAPARKLRSDCDAFDWKTMCFFCTQPVRDCIETTVHSRRVMTTEFLTKIANQCELRSDSWAEDVRRRLDCSIGDLVAREAVYHVYCYGRFKRYEEMNPDFAVAGRPENSI